MEQNEARRGLVDATKTLDKAKEEYTDIVESTFDAYEKAGGKLTLKGLKTVAKAVVKAETQKESDFHSTVADALANIGK